MGDAKPAPQGGQVDSAVDGLTRRPSPSPLGGIHDVLCGYRKEDMMESREPAIPLLEKVISEIALVLGEGYLRYQSRRRLPTSNPDMAGHVKHTQQSEKITEIPLDCSANIGLHTYSGPRDGGTNRSVSETALEKCGG